MLVACGCTVEVLEGQKRQESWPASSWNVPRGQLSHSRDTMLKKVPTGHWAAVMNEIRWVFKKAFV